MVLAVFNFSDVPLDVTFGTEDFFSHLPESKKFTRCLIQPNYLKRLIKLPFPFKYPCGYLLTQSRKGFAKTAKIRWRICTLMAQTS